MIICLSDMVANAFIELQKRELNINELSLTLIEKYGDEVAKKIKEDGTKTMFSLSRNATEYFRTQYQEFFTLKENDYNSETTVKLNDGIKIDILIKNFRGYLPLNLLLAYANEDVVQKGLLNNIYESEKQIVKKKFNKIIAK